MENSKKISLKDDERMATIPLIAHEMGMARLELVIKWLIAIIVLLVVVIGIGVYQIMGCDFSSVMLDSADGGVASYLNAGNDGVINNAEDSNTGADAQE